MSLDQAILGFLSEESLSGYDLKTRCFDGAAAHFWTADQAQVYRTLERLHRARLVASTRVRQKDRPDRRVYRITDAGREALETWLSSAHPIAPYRDPFLIQLYFAGALPADETLGVMRDRRALHQQRLEAVRSERAGIRVVAGSPAGYETALRRLTYDAVIAAERAAIDWLDDCIETVSTHRGTETGSDEGPASLDSTAHDMGGMSV